MTVAYVFTTIIEQDGSTSEIRTPLMFDSEPTEQDLEFCRSAEEEHQAYSHFGFSFSSIPVVTTYSKETS